MENPFFVRNALWLRVDFMIQAILVSINTCLVLLGLFGLLSNHNIAGGTLIWLLMLQVWIGIIQFGCSAIPHFLGNNPFLNTHRKIHFFVGIIIMVGLFFNIYIFTNILDGVNSYFEFAIVWSFILGFPQILMYYYFWITWHYYKKTHTTTHF